MQSKYFLQTFYLVCHFDLWFLTLQNVKAEVKQLRLFWYAVNKWKFTFTSTTAPLLHSIIFCQPDRVWILRMWQRKAHNAQSTQAVFHLKKRINIWAFELLFLNEWSVPNRLTDGFEIHHKSCLQNLWMIHSITLALLPLECLTCNSDLNNK